MSVPCPTTPPPLVQALAHTDVRRAPPRVGAFGDIASLERSKATDGLYSIVASSDWVQATAPAFERLVVQFDPAADGLRALCDLIDASLAAEARA